MLTSKQRAQLRALASNEQTILQIGKGGIGENLVVQVNDALEAREIVKLHVLETAGESAKNLGVMLADKTGAELVQVIGFKIVLYRESKNKKSIVLVK